MKYNPVGKTDLKVSALSFGAGTAAGLMVNGDLEDQVAAVRAAVEAGVNHFDTAAFYGFGASEIYLGQALRAAGAGDVLVTSKVAIGREFLETRRLRAAVRQSVEQSLSRLRRERIDILLMHNATHRSHAPYDAGRESQRVARIMNTYIPAVTPDDLLGEEGILEEIDLLIREGKIGAFGLSGQDNHPDVIKSLAATGRIAIFNQTYSLMNPTAGWPQARGGRKVEGDFARYQRELFIDFDDSIEAAREAGVGVSVISAMAAGVLTEAAVAGEAIPTVSRRINRFPFEGQYDRQRALAARFRPIAQAAGMTLQELAMRFVLSTPGVTTLVAGISNAGQLRELLPAVDRPPLGEDVLEAVREVWFGGGLGADADDRPAEAADLR